MGKRMIRVEFTMLLYLMLRFIWDLEQNSIRVNGFIFIYIMVNQKQTWGYLEGGSNSPVNSLSLWNSNLKAIPQTGSVVAQLFHSNVIPKISRWNRVWFQKLSRSLSAAEPLKGANVMVGSTIKATHQVVAFQMRVTFHSFRQTSERNSPFQREQRRRRSQ